MSSEREARQSMDKLRNTVVTHLSVSLLLCVCVCLSVPVYVCVCLYRFVCLFARLAKLCSCARFASTGHPLMGPAQGYSA